MQSIPDDKKKPNVRNELVTLGNLLEENALGLKRVFFSADYIIVMCLKTLIFKAFLKLLR